MYLCNVNSLESVEQNYLWTKHLKAVGPTVCIVIETYKIIMTIQNDKYIIFQHA